MLAKLYKYDMKSIIRQMGVIWILAPIIAGAFGVAISKEIPSASYEYEYMPTFYLSEFFPMILGVVLFGVCVAIAAMTLIFIIQRFWGGLLGDEGYLMFTLPVKTGDLIFSKVLSSASVMFLSMMSGFLSILIFVLVLNPKVDLLAVIPYLIEEFKIETGIDNVAPFVLTILLAGITSVFFVIYQIYVSMALGQMYTKHRIIASCVCYMAIHVLLSVMVQIADLIIPYVTIFELPIAMFVYSVWNIVVAVVFHFVIRYVFSHRLNLE